MNVDSPHKDPVMRNVDVFSDVELNQLLNKRSTKLLGFETPWRSCDIIVIMMTSSNGDIFRVTGPLCGEFTGPGEFPTQRPVTRSFDVFFDLRLNKRLSKQPRGRWFQTQLWSLWRHCNGPCKIPVTVTTYLELGPIQMTTFLSKFKIPGQYKILHMIRQLRSHGVCKILLRSDHQEMNYTRTEFPSNLKCGWKYSVTCSFRFWVDNSIIGKILLSFTKRP